VLEAERRDSGVRGPSLIMPTALSRRRFSLLLQSVVSREGGREVGGRAGADRCILIKTAESSGRFNSEFHGAELMYARSAAEFSKMRADPYICRAN
jgi:hypothetical protein